MSTALTPQDWNIRKDIVVYVGMGHEDDIWHVTELGQERVVVYLPGTYPATGYPIRAKVARNLVELRNTFDDARWRIVLPRSVRVQYWPDGKVSRDELDQINLICRQELDAIVSRMATLELLGRLWVKHGILNLPTLAKTPSIQQLLPIMQGKPAVIVSSGPSLDKNVSHLANAKGFAIIICIAGALRTVQKAGVTPDIIISADPLDQLPHFEGCPTSDSMLVLAATSQPELFALPSRKTFWFSGNHLDDGWFTSMLSAHTHRRIAHGGSVSTMATGMALWWRAPTVILVGQDLAMAGEQLYAHGSRQIVPHAPLVDAPGYYGGTVRAPGDYDLFRRWFEAIALDAKGKYCLINATEGGAHIEGWYQRDLAEAILINLPNVLNFSGDGLTPPPVCDISMPLADIDVRMERIARLARVAIENVGARPALEKHCDEETAILTTYFADFTNLERLIAGVNEIRSWIAKARGI